jgi:CRP/FNR family cyclic AMP-dependent transcriptional regulator
MSIIRPPAREPEWLRPFLSHCHLRYYPKNTEIIHPGDPADVLYYLVEGSVTALIEDEGRELILAYINKGEFIGEMAMFVAQATRSTIVRSRSDCRMAEISYVRLEQLFQGALQPHTRDILYAIETQLSRRLKRTSTKVSHLTFYDVTGRIARTLLDLCRQPDAITHPDGMQIRITRQEIGQIVGCSREMAGRVLKNLEQQGVLTAKGKTIVVFGTR